MELRKTIKTPARYSEDVEFVASRRVPGFFVRQEVRPVIIEFNPNLPPAAFPTLEGPSAALKRSAKPATSEGRRSPDGEVTRKEGSSAAIAEDANLRPSPSQIVRSENDTPSYTVAQDKTRHPRKRQPNVHADKSHSVSCTRMIREVRFTRDMKEGDEDGREQPLKRFVGVP